MKKTWSALPGGWLVLSLLLGSGRGLAQDSRAGVRLLGREQTPAGMRVVLAIDDPAVSTVRGPDGRAYTRLTLEGAGEENEYGQPALPLVHYAGPVPSGMKVVVSAQERKHKELKVTQALWPHQKPIPKLSGAREAAGFVVDAAAYGGAKGATFQKALGGELAATQFRKRGQDYVDVLARPFAYQAQPGVVRYPAELVLEFAYVEPELPKAAGPRLGRIVVLGLTLEGPEDLDRLEQDGYNFERRGMKRVEVFATEAEAETLRRQGYAIEETGEQRVVPGGASREGGGIELQSGGGYHDYTTLSAELQQQSVSHADVCRLYSIGQSVLGRELWAMKITDRPEVDEGKPRVRLAGAMHGDEPVGTELCLRLIDELLNGRATDGRVSNLVAGTEIWILPLLNPDGLEAGTRFNAGGYDLNRSFPDGGGGGLGNVVFGPPAGVAGRPPEVARMMEFSMNRSFALAANFHGGALVVNYPYDDDDLGSVNSPTPDEALFRVVSLAYASQHVLMSASSLFPQGIVNGAAWYVVNGGMQDWHYRYVGCNEVTIELGEVKRPPSAQLPSLWAENRESMFSFLESVQMGVRGQVTDAATGEALRAAVKPLGIEHAVFSDPTHGAYHRLLLPGSYALLVTAPGYVTRVVSNVVVQAGQTTMLDLALSRAEQSQDRLLLVTSAVLEPSLAALQARKEADGFEVQTAVVPNGTAAGRVRTAVREAYATFPADYVLLVGDTPQIPTFDDGHATDLLYALIDAGEGLSDYMGKDVVLGRISLQTTAAVGQFVQKLTAFALTCTNRVGDLTWVSHGNTTAEWDQAERAHDYSIAHCVPATVVATRFFRDHGTATQLTSHVNAGTDGLIYSGHAFETAWSRFSYDLSALAGLHNLTHVPIVIGHCCVSGNFGLATCFAEGWLQTTARGVAYLGASADTLWDEDEWMQKAEFDAMQWTPGLSIGRAMDEGLREVHRRSPGKAQYYFTAYHLLGDPTLVLFDAAPMPLAIRMAAALELGNCGIPYVLVLQAAGGEAPYVWRLVDGQLPDGLRLDETAGVIQGTPTRAATNQFTLEVQDASPSPATVVQAFTLEVQDLSAIFNQLVDVEDWLWNSGGSAQWQADTATTHDGTDAAATGTLSDSQRCWAETTVTGPGLLSFWWKVSSESDYDFLRFSVNGTEQAGRISGNVDWQLRTFTLAVGSQALRWSYTKDGSDTSGSDCGWLDQIQFVPDAPPVEPAFLPVVRQGGSLLLQFATVASRAYDVEYTDGVEEPGWTVLTTVVGNGSVRSVAAPIAPSGRRFYRLRVH